MYRELYRSTSYNELENILDGKFKDKITSASKDITSGDEYYDKDLIIVLDKKAGKKQKEIEYTYEFFKKNPLIADYVGMDNLEMEKFEAIESEYDLEDLEEKFDREIDDYSELTDEEIDELAEEGILDEWAEYYANEKEVMIYGIIKPQDVKEVIYYDKIYKEISERLDSLEIPYVSLSDALN